MARTRCRFPSRILVVSLQVQNPTAVERRETPAGTALGVTTRARSRRIAAAVAALPEEILVFEIFVRLSAKDILRCRAVCRYWRILTSAPNFLLAHRQRQPSLLFLTLYEEAMLAWNERATTNLAQPVVFHNYLHWDLGSDAGILVFNTVVESFRLMCRPADATKLCTRLCDMEDSIGFSCFGSGKTFAKIWVLEDHEREVWTFKYHVKIPMWYFGNLEDTRHLVLSREGDVLVYSPSYGYMCHCDNTGKLLEKFQYDSSSMSRVGPWFKESLIKHDFFPRRGCTWIGQLRFF